MTVLKTSNTSIYVQFVPGGPSYFLGDCIDLDSIPNPRGDFDILVCWNRQRNGYRSLGKKLGPPGVLSFSLSELVQSAASYLENIKCDFNIYALQNDCGGAGIFDNWVRGSIVTEAAITDDPISNIANHASDDETMREVSVSAIPPRIDVFWPLASRRTTTEALALNAIAICDLLRCGFTCGTQIKPGDRFLSAADAVALGTANVQYSLDHGVTIQAAAVDPFIADENILAAECFEVSQTTVRWIVVRETDPADNLEGAYSDDLGATWTLVNVGTTNAETVAGPNAIFALDSQHIWIATDDGNVFFSSDAGQTWTDQGALGASGANALAAIHFVDEKIGYAVGAADTVIYTTDGGVNWAAAGATGTAADLQAVWVFSQYRVLVGSIIDTQGSLQMTYDGGDNWEAKVFDGYTTEEVAAMSFANDFVGMIVTNTAGPVGSAHMTIDGGHSWREIEVPGNVGLNDIAMVDQYEAFAVGEVQGTTAMVIRIGGLNLV